KVTGGIVAHVVGIPDEELGQVVAAVVAVDRDADFDETALRRELKAELSAYKIPGRFAVVRHDEIPVLSSGKVDLPRLGRLFDA
ncbi:MAG: long-chain fatty acid--CoA ligase, partial [Mycolicibacterium sp.]|nr:long-chain fatty acid--CoA ligase [Mycolicibacterium sp.]